jgi:hypothetical protein
VGDGRRRNDDKWNGDHECDDGYGEKCLVILWGEERVMQKEEAILVKTMCK